MNQAASQNYFELFDLSVDYGIDLKQLSENYRQLQSAVHPDKFANAGDRERRLAVQNAALINEAYQVLKSPLKRARYILELNGLEFDDERETTFEPEFLMEQMELRESIAEIKDKSDPLQELDSIVKSINSKTNSMTEDIQSRIASSQFEQAKATVLKLQFLYRLRQECEALEEELLDVM